MPKIEHVCQFCGKKFMAWAYKKRRACSRSCGNRNFFQGVGFPSWNWKGGEAVPGSHGRPVLNLRVDGVRAVKYESVAIAEKALGRPLPNGAIVHHLDRLNTNNSHTNLVICQDQGYHLLIHARQRIIDRGGVPYRDKICSHCGDLKPVEEFYPKPANWDGRYAYCRECTSTIAKSKRRAS